MEARAVHSLGTYSYLLVVFLQVDHLLGETLNLHLQVRASHGQLIQHSAQAIDVCLYTLTETQLILIPEGVAGSQTVSWLGICQSTSLSFTSEHFGK